MSECFGKVEVQTQADTRGRRKLIGELPRERPGRDNADPANMDHLPEQPMPTYRQRRRQLLLSAPKLLQSMPLQVQPRQGKCEHRTVQEPGLKSNSDEGARPDIVAKLAVPKQAKIVEDSHRIRLRRTRSHLLIFRPVGPVQTEQRLRRGD